MQLGEETKQKSGCALIRGKAVVSAHGQPRPQRLGQESHTPAHPWLSPQAGTFLAGGLGFFVPPELLPSLAAVINELY